MDSYGNEVRMSVNFSSIRVYGLAIAMSLGALLAGCGQSSDPGAERSQQQSEGSQAVVARVKSPGHGAQHA